MSSRRTHERSGRGRALRGQNHTNEARRGVVVAVIPFLGLSGPRGRSGASMYGNSLHPQRSRSKCCSNNNKSPGGEAHRRHCHSKLQRKSGSPPTAPNTWVFLRGKDTPHHPHPPGHPQGEGSSDKIHRRRRESSHSPNGARDVIRSHHRDAAGPVTFSRRLPGLDARFPDRWRDGNAHPLGRTATRTTLIRTPDDGQ